MQELFRHWRAGRDAGMEHAAELWSGGPLPELRGNPGYRCLHALSRENRWIRRASWGQRYAWEQKAALFKSMWALQRRRADLIYCGDPILCWHLKRLQPLHGASVVFMNGTRLSANWANHLDGVHLIADPYLDQAREELGGRLKAHFFAAPHFVDTQLFTPPLPEETRRARASFGLPDSAFLVLTIGPLGRVSGKRTEFLAREIAKAPSRVHLAHAGIEEDGAAEVRAEIDQALPGRIHWLGPMPRDRMPLLYRCANAYSLGSLAEPFSIAILEALATGLPVVHHHDSITMWVSGPGGIPVDMTANGHAGESFRQLEASPERCAQLGGAARQWAVERYAPEAIVPDIVAQLSETRRRFLTESGSAGGTVRTPAS